MMLELRPDRRQVFLERHQTFDPASILAGSHFHTESLILPFLLGQVFLSKKYLAVCYNLSGLLCVDLSLKTMTN
jgi:hypothetical protein